MPKPLPPSRDWHQLLARAQQDRPPAIDVRAGVRQALAAADPAESVADRWDEFGVMFCRPLQFFTCGSGTLAAAAVTVLVLRSSTTDLDPFIRLLLLGHLPGWMQTLAL